MFTQWNCRKIRISWNALKEIFHGVFSPKNVLCTWKIYMLRIALLHEFLIRNDNSSYEQMIAVGQW